MTITQNAYLTTRVMTASPAELRLLLFDGAIRFLRQGIDGLEKKDYEGSYEGYSQCQAIIVELLNALDPSQAPELCERLSALYTFMYTQLVESLTERDIPKGREVLELLEYERETWVQVMSKLVDEQAAGAASTNAAASNAAGGAGAGPTQPGMAPAAIEGAASAGVGTARDATPSSPATDAVAARDGQAGQAAARATPYGRPRQPGSPMRSGGDPGSSSGSGLSVRG